MHTVTQSVRHDNNDFTTSFSIGEVDHIVAELSRIDIMGIDPICGNGADWLNDYVPTNFYWGLRSSLQAAYLLGNHMELLISLDNKHQCGLIQELKGMINDPDGSGEIPSLTREEFVAAMDDFYKL